MDANAGEQRDLQPSGREKRSLRSAIQGTPPRPEPKCVRAIEDAGKSAPGEAQEAAQDGGALYTRFINGIYHTCMTTCARSYILEVPRPAWCVADK